MLNGKKAMTPLAVGTAALLALAACTGEDDANAETGEDQVAAPAEEEAADTDPAEDEASEEESDPDAEAEDSGTELPPGGFERIADEDIDPDTQGEPIEADFSEEGAEIGFNESAADNPPVDVYAAPPEITPESGPDDTTEATAELSPDDVVLLGGREIAAAQADGVWVEIELADGYGWVESRLLEGFEAP